LRFSFLAQIDEPTTWVQEFEQK